MLRKSQSELATLIGVWPARIQSVEQGRVMPKPKSWPRLMLAFKQPDNSLPQLTEREFYRMCVTASREFRLNKKRSQEKAQGPAKSYPLIDAEKQYRRAEFLSSRYTTHLDAPAGMIVRAES